MKLAIVQDELLRKGGAERVVLLFNKAFPDAPIYTLSYNPELTYPEFSQCKIKQTWYGRIIKSEKWLKRTFYPFGILAMKSLRLKKYDVILISSTHLGKYITPNKNCIVINYCHTPFRLVWDPESYSQYVKANFFSKKAMKFVIGHLKKIELRFTKHTHLFLTNSLISKLRIETAYNPKREIKIIPPSINHEQLIFREVKEDFYLVVSRMEYYKKVDIAVKAFNKLNKPLVIVGNGSQKEYLKKIALNNISFKENISQKELSELYSKAKALIFPQLEDYGITPLESIASGTPVIAYGKGGVLETMIPYSNDAAKATAYIFPNQNVGDLINAVNSFENLKFDPYFLRNHSMKFSDAEFIKKIREVVSTSI